MNAYEGNITSKLPQTGTSIFAVMTQLATQHKALNLAQGFPDFPVSKQLIELVNHYMKKGLNQYAPMPGIKPLRDALSKLFRQNYGAVYNPETEITITAGATQALYTIITALVHKGDEVLIFEPAYDSYAPAITLNGGLVKHSQLHFPDYRINWEEVTRMISSRTRMIIINSPHNPTGSILTKEDLIRLERLTHGTDIVILSDEVYEHLIFDGLKHDSVCLFQELASRSLIVGSFGKTFHATGWKTGFILAPEKLTKEVRKVHQFMVFAVNTPIQYAVADFLKDPDNYLHLGEFYQQKRDFFLDTIKDSKFKPLSCHGTYFQLLDYSAISDKKEMEFAEWLVKEHQLAAVPVSPFYREKVDNHTLRFCFAKTEETLQKAGEILCRI
ncbi:MAG: methionine aminotransferase [Bacteroidetes bacterium]|nr:methionine aminotransferase [Bacteroidota bacterium]